MRRNEFVTQFLVEIPGNRTVHATLSTVLDVRMMVIDNLDGYQVNSPGCPAHYVSFHKNYKTLRGDELLYWEWIEVYQVSKKEVSEEQKQSYLSYSREKKFKVGGATPYPVVEVHKHNHMPSQNVSEEEIEKAVYVIEAIRDFCLDIYEDPEKRKQYEDELNYLKRYYQSEEIESVKLLKLTWGPDRGTTYSTWEGHPAELVTEYKFDTESEELKKKAELARKLPIKGKMLIQEGEAVFDEPVEYVFGEEPVYPALLAFRFNNEAVKSQNILVLPDIADGRERVWERILDELLKRGYMPKSIICQGSQHMVIEYCVFSLFNEIATDDVNGTIDWNPDRRLGEALQEKMDEIREEEEHFLSLEEDKLSQMPVSYVLGISLRYSYFCDHNVYREIQIDRLDAFYDLHMAIQRAVNFDNDHGFAFRVPGIKRYNGDLAGFPDGSVIQESGSPFDTILAKADLKKGSKFKYVFDFGDHWEFEIKVKDVLLVETARPKVLSREGEDPEQYPGWD